MAPESFTDTEHVEVPRADPNTGDRMPCVENQASSPADPNAGASTASVANMAMPKEKWEEAKAWAGHEAFAEDVEERLASADPDATAAADTGQGDGTGLLVAFSAARGGIGKLSKPLSLIHI